MSEPPSTQEAPPVRATERLAADAVGIARAAALLRDGRLVGLPTETVYGLGANGRDPAAVAALYAAKGRPRFNPLIAHLPDAAAARREGALDEPAERLASVFWPGPLTLVVPVSGTGTVSDLARAGLPSIGLRVPAHPVAAAILRGAGVPVVAPSANRSGRVSPTRAEHVLADLDGRIDAVLDDGPCPVGLESTIVACLGDRPRLLRAGGVPREAIERVLGHALAGHDDPAAWPGTRPGVQPLAPGMLLSHYAPRAAVRLDATAIEPGEAALLFGPGAPAGLDGAAAQLNLSPTGDLADAAAALFGHLRRLDAGGVATIAVTPIPGIGLGEAINDRLRRAAAER